MSEKLGAVTVANLRAEMKALREDELKNSRVHDSRPPSSPPRDSQSRSESPLPSDPNDLVRVEIHVPEGESECAPSSESIGYESSFPEIMPDNHELIYYGDAGTLIESSEPNFNLLDDFDFNIASNLILDRFLELHPE